MNERETLKINSNGVLEIGGVDAVSLVKQYQTPLYVMDKAYIKSICNVYVNTIKDFYGDGAVAYASKAFSCKEIYRIMKDSSMSIDVVSAGELYTALSVGFPAEKIYFHGNNKSFFELDLAVKNNVGTIVLDAYQEADILNDICEKYNKTQNVLIRTNPGIEAHTHHYIQTAKIDSKFGFSISNLEALEMAKYTLNKKNLKLKGLHCHIGSQIFEKKSFELAVDKMTDFYLEIKNVLNYEFEVLNLGGGFGVYYTDEDAKLSVTDYAEYIKTIAKKLNDCVIKKGIKKPYLVIEPGRSIVGEAGVTLYTAGNIKTIPKVKNYLSVDGGMFDNPRFALYSAKYTVKIANRMLDKPEKYYTVSGKCCESGDIIAENCYLPTVKSGDIVATFSTGAYNYSMASNYNRNLVPPVVMVENGKSYYAVKPQTLEDLLRNDV